MSKSSASTALTTTNQSVVPVGKPASSSSSSAPMSSSEPFASTVWDPSIRGWLSPTATQTRTALLLEDKSKALALAHNRAANVVVLHTTSTGPRKQKIEARAPAHVLEEEEYLDGMDRIIRRDFFPAIEAMERKIAQPTPLLGMRSSQLLGTPATPAASSVAATPMRREGELDDFASPPALEPAFGSATSAAASSSKALQLRSSSAAAPAAASSTSSSSASQPQVHRHDLRLGSYLELHTSEDNASFDEMNVKRRKEIHDKYWWANEDFERKVNDQRLILVASDKNRNGILDTAKYQVKNAVFFYPDHGGQSQLDVDTADTPAEAVKRAQQLKSKSIDYENTRFPGALYNPFPGRNKSSHDPPDADAASASSARAGSATPNVSGFRLVRTPSPVPGASGESPLVTWGQIIGTPAHIEQEDFSHPSSSAPSSGRAQDPESDIASLAALGPNPTFRVADISSRERTLMNLVDSARKKEEAKRKRKREDATPVPIGYASPLIGGATPRTPLTSGAASAGSRSNAAAASSAHVRMMSPAAQRLMEKTMRATGKSSHATGFGGAKSSVDSQLRASYGTPSPSQLQHGIRNRPAVPLFNATPSRR